MAAPWRRRERWVVLVYVAVVALLVGGFVVAVTRPDWQLIPVERVEANSQSRSVSLTVSHAECDTGPRVRIVAETGTVVRLRAEQSRRSCDDIGLTSVVVVDLADNLAGRRIEIEDRGGPEIEPQLRCIVDGSDTGRCRQVGATD